MTEVIVWHPGLSLKIAVWLKADWLPGLFIRDKEISFLGRWLPVVAQSSVFIHALAIVHLYIMSFMILEPEIYSCLPDEWYFIV